MILSIVDSVFFVAHKIGVNYKINVDKRKMKYYNKSDIEIFTYISKILLEKYKGKESTEYLDKVINEIEENKNYYNNEGKEVLIIMLEQILRRKIGDKHVNEIIKKLKGDDERMLNFLESVDRENKAIYNKGIKDTKMEIIKEMLKMKIPINQISKITHYTEEKIRKIKY